MSDKRFEASGGIYTTLGYEDTEQLLQTSFFISSDKIAQLREQIRMQKEAEEKGEQLVGEEESFDLQDPKIYRGATGYHQYIKKTEAQLSNNKFTGTQGPIRATSHIAISNRFDYQPDVCKDYKETGYCAFGDSCIFLHDRGDYKSGWEIVAIHGLSHSAGTRLEQRAGRKTQATRARRSFRG